MNYILYNPKSGAKKGDSKIEELKQELNLKEATTLSVLEINYDEFN